MINGDDGDHLKILSINWMGGTSQRSTTPYTGKVPESFAQEP